LADRKRRRETLWPEREHWRLLTIRPLFEKARSEATEVAVTER
jgi:hypothetical protein